MLKYFYKFHNINVDNYLWYNLICFFRHLETYELACTETDWLHINYLLHNELSIDEIHIEQNNNETDSLENMTCVIIFLRKACLGNTNHFASTVLCLSIALSGKTSKIPNERLVMVQSSLFWGILWCFFLNITNFKVRGTPYLVFWRIWINNLIKTNSLWFVCWADQYLSYPSLIIS